MLVEFNLQRPYSISLQMVTHHHRITMLHQPGGRCRIMPTANENKCCKQRPCVTTSPTFENLVMSRESLHVQLLATQISLLIDPTSLMMPCGMLCTANIYYGRMDILAEETAGLSLHVQLGQSEGSIQVQMVFTLALLTFSVICNSFDLLRCKNCFHSCFAFHNTNVNLSSRGIIINTTREEVI